jgi:Rrf2 family protein
VHISAKVDYAVRALVALAAANSEPVTGAELARRQNLPAKYLEGLLAELRRAQLLVSQRGPVGGYHLARPAEEIPIADVIRAIDGPLAEVRGLRPEMTSYEGEARELQDVWIAVRAALRDVLERTTLADVAFDRLPAHVKHLAADPEAWRPH